MCFHLPSFITYPWVCHCPIPFIFFLNFLFLCQIVFVPFCVFIAFQQFPVFVSMVFGLCLVPWFFDFAWSLSGLVCSGWVGYLCDCLALKLRFCLFELHPVSCVSLYVWMSVQLRTVARWHRCQLQILGVWTWWLALCCSCSLGIIAATCALHCNIAWSSRSCIRPLVH